MNKPAFIYTDWYQGRVYLETCAIIYDKRSETPRKALLTDFSESTLKKIKLKQREIFDYKSAELLLKFKSIFEERYKKSEAKELLLKREVEDNRKILFLIPIQELHFKNRSFTLSKDDLLVMRDFINNQIVKGEKNYSFIHSPNFRFQNVKFTDDLVYARVTFDYYKWLLKFQSLGNKLKADSKTNQTAVQKKGGSNTDRIKVKVIALIYVYNSEPINRNNCSEIAAKYHYYKKMSGEGLFQDYLKFSIIRGRTKLNGDTKVRCLNRLKLIESAISHLKGRAKENAERDYQILEKSIDGHEW